jgi:hypothetical protein
MSLRNRIKRTTRHQRRASILRSEVLKAEDHRLAYGIITCPYYGDRDFWYTSKASKHLRYLLALIRSRKDEERFCAARNWTLPPVHLAASKWRKALALGPILAQPETA